jgi:hypothetical protein
MASAIKAKETESIFNPEAAAVALASEEKDTEEVKKRARRFFEDFCKPHCPPIIEIVLPGGEVIRI